MASLIDPSRSGSERQATVVARFAAHSNETLEAMRAEGKDITWRHSYGTEDKSFCIYEAADEGLVQEHSERSGFPADVISEVGGIIGPETADG